MTYFEKDFAVLGLDIYDFAGSMLRKVAHLSDRVGFELLIPQEKLLPIVNQIFNKRASRTRRHHVFKKYHRAETTLGKAERAREAEVFELNQPPAAAN